MCCVLVPMEWKNVRELLTLQNIIIIIIVVIDDWSMYEFGLTLIWQFIYRVWVCRHNTFQPVAHVWPTAGDKLKV
jgi:hypothetical protein